MSIGQELLNVPMGDMIRQMAMAIAEAQFELDKSSIMVAEMMGGQRLLRDEHGRLIDYNGDLLSAKRDPDGNPTYDQEGNLVYEDGRGPRVIDSRVHFGYTYEPVMGEDGKTPQRWGTDGPVKMVRKPKLVSMMELGFTPTFYQFVDTIIEVKIAIRVTDENSLSYSAGRSESTTTNADIIEPVKVISWSYDGGSGAIYKSQKTGTRQTVVTTNVDGSYSSKYSYSAEGASLLRTKLVPIPPPAILEERIREVMEAERAYLRDAAAGATGVYETSAGGSKRYQDFTPKTPAKGADGGDK